MDDKFKLRCAVYPLFIKRNKILLYKRVNTGWEDGKYGVPGGHLEANETALDAACREAKEETGLEIKPNDLRFLHACQRKSNHDYLDLFFEVSFWNGEPRLTEENKSDDIVWADVDKLPGNTLEYVKALVKNIKQKKLYSQFGW